MHFWRTFNPLVKIVQNQMACFDRNRKKKGDVPKTSESGGSWENHLRPFGQIVPKVKLPVLPVF